MKFKLVENINGGHENVSSNELLEEHILIEGDNTNLRRFLLSLVELADINIDMSDPVIHHITKNTTINGIYDLVIMEDHDHRSMHAKYRNKEWNDNAHKPYKYIEVKDILSKALYNLEQTAHSEEVKLAKEFNNK